MADLTINIPSPSQESSPRINPCNTIYGLCNRNCIKINICFWIAAIIFAFTYGFSYSPVYYYQYGLIQNRYGAVDLTNVLIRGRYFNTLDKYIITFPSTFNIIRYSTSVFTNDGLEVNLEISFQYRLKIDTLPSIYTLYSNNYNARISNMAQTLIKDNVYNYTITDYVNNRQRIEDNLGYILQTTLGTVVGIDCPRQFFRLLSFTLPGTVLSTSLVSAIELQNNQIQAYQQQLAVIQSDTSLKVSAINANANAVLAFAQNNANQIIQNSQSSALNIVNTARGNGIQTIFNSLNITDPIIKSQIITIFAIMDSNSTDLKILHTTNPYILNI